MSVRLGKKGRGRREELCTNDAYLRKCNIAVLQGTSSQKYGRSVFDCGGVRSLVFYGYEETRSEGKEKAQMAQSFRTIGARGPNVWFITHGPCPSKTWLFDANGVKVADFQAGPGYQIVQGRHPSGVPYRVLVDAPALEIDVSSLIWI
ncbi:MAG: hypothetical protein VXW84_13355, partial [Verrucomicrobiota bacterium]|nr:hypothetical protein [Verrucomicrobiota bacterium]